MPPKRRPEQHDKSATSKSRNNGTIRSSPRGKPQARRDQSPGEHSLKSIPQWRLPKGASTSDYKTKIETLWKTMGNSRVGERQNAIKNGLMADPDKRTTLANAIRVVGTCQDMCPEFERIQRIRENAVDRAEKVTTSGGAKVADELRMVKAFHRPDAGKEEQLPSDLRPPAVLKKTVRYLLDKVASPSSSLAEHHKFVWDRTRCIRNDFTIQASGRLDDIKTAVECYEEIARFHILSLHQMPKIGKHDYDAQQELEQLSATLLSLFEYYDDNRGKYEAPREAEFRSYKLLIDLRSRTNDTFEKVQTWPARIRDSFHVQTAVQLCQASGTIFTDTTSMLSPYSRAVRVEQAAYEKFWSILESPKVDYIMACAASVSFNEIRARTLETMAKVYRSGPQSRLQDISLEELTFALGLDSSSQTRKLCRETGLHVSKHANGVSYLDLDELNGPLPKSIIASAEQTFSRSIVEVKREDRAFSAIYHGYDVSYCKENDLIDESESDADFDPDKADIDSEDDQDESLFVDDEQDEHQGGSDDVLKIEANSTSNPFGLKSSREAVPQLTAPVFGGFGRPSGTQAASGSTGKSSNPFATSNSFTSSSASTNPFEAATQPNAAQSGKVMFGQSSGSVGKSTESFKTHDTAGLASTGSVNFPTSSTSTSQAPAGGLFQWTTPTPSVSTQSKSSTTLGALAQTPNQDMSSKQDRQSNQTATSKKPLFPFTFPAVSKEETGTAVSGSSHVSQPSKITPDSQASYAPSFSFVPPVENKTHLQPSLDGQNAFEATTKPTQTEQRVSKIVEGTISAEKSLLPAQNSLESSSPFSARVSSSATAAGRAAQIPPSTTSAQPLSTMEKVNEPVDAPKPRVSLHPIITQKQKDDVLDLVAKELVSSQYGILEQFIEAELGHIYDKAQRKVTKERTQARLEEIKISLLGSKFLYVWRLKVEEKLRRRKAMQRRERMRQSQRDESREHSVSGFSSPVQDVSVLNQADAQFHYLTRGFNETFEKSTSTQLGSPSHPSNGEMQASTRPMLQPHKRSRHSRSQTVDGSTIAFPNIPSSASMPPPNNPRNSSAFVRSRTTELRPFVGSGFLQSAALRREAINFARRSGSNTTTSSDYFRLKARNIDPDTKAIPSTKKRTREIGDNYTSHMSLKARRLSDSTTSTLSISETTREMLARSGLSDNAISLLTAPSPSTDISVSGTTTPRYTTEEDELFEAARKLRETLAEDTSWMRSMREEQDNDENALKAETPAQRRLREFKMTPSKTSIRLRQTHANGLLPPDYFEKQETTKKTPTVNRSLINGISADTPTRKMGLAALPDNRNRQSSEVGSTKTLQSIGTSLDDAIEL